MSKELKVGSKVKNKKTGVTRTIIAKRGEVLGYKSGKTKGACKVESMKKWASGNN